MARPRIFRAAALLTATALASVLLYPAPTAGAGEGTAEKIQWAATFTSALEQAAFERRPLMLSFTASWCGWCRKLERVTYTDQEVIRHSRLFVNVRVEGPRQKDLVRRYQVRAYPTTVFLDSDGTMMSQVRGYIAPGEMKELLQRIVDNQAQEFILRQRLKDHPELIDIRYDLALLLLGRGACEPAIAELDSILVSDGTQGNTDMWAIRLDRARALLAGGRAAEAREALRDLVEEQPHPDRLPEAIYLLGEASVETGKNDEARKWFRRVLELRPKGWIAERSRARLGDLG